MTYKFSIQPIARFDGKTEPVKRPKEFACFSYDADHKFHLGDSGLRWYYPPQAMGADLSQGFDSFVKHDDSVDEHLDSLLKSIIAHEKDKRKAIDAHVVTWRGMLTKIMAAPYEDRDGFEMNATLYRNCLFIEENHQYKEACREQQAARPWHGLISQEVMQFWGYKFETLCTLRRPWGEVSRDEIENRENEQVNNNEQYCSVVRTGLGKTICCLGGEVDAIWDQKPTKQGDPIKWVELKTTAEIRSDRDADNFERKLLKYWIQSLLLGVPKVIVGFRTWDGKLVHIQEFETVDIPVEVLRRGRARWNASLCINFGSQFLDWLRQTINDEGIWRIRRKPQSQHIEIFKIEEVGHGSIITDDFMNWRIRLALNQDAVAES